MKQMNSMTWTIAALLGLASVGKSTQGAGRSGGGGRSAIPEGDNASAISPGECSAWQADYVLIEIFSPFKDKVEYPEIVRTLARKWARIFHVPSSWIISQAYVESQNRPLASNPRTGATGLLQIKLIRARDLVKWLSRSKWAAQVDVQKTLKTWHNRRSNLLAPELNVMLAAFDLHHLRNKFGHDHSLVAAAYNQGEGCIARCLTAGSPLPRKAIEYIARVERAKKRGYS